MNIGILKEKFENEERVALTPAAVESLVYAGNNVIVERNAGAAAKFTNDSYQEAGATVAYSSEEVIGRSDMIVKVIQPDDEELALLHEGQVLLSFLHFGVATRDFIGTLEKKNITAIAFELIEDSDGYHSVLSQMSEIAGQLAIVESARYLCTDKGGRGLLLGGMPGVAPAAVVILGAGSAGRSAARTALGMGAQVILLDKDLAKLRQADIMLEKRATTVVASPDNIRRGISFADVFIGAITIDEEEDHHMVTEEMVKTMKAGGIIMDISIDEGGCVETTHPTTISDPVFTKYGVLHYCVPNMPSMVARSSTYALTNAILPLVKTVAAVGVRDALRIMPHLSKGIALMEGVPVAPILEEMLDIPVHPLSLDNDHA